jgi:serine/threonine-protein phosphatase 6 regulatory ankyrin repeat subunit B
MNTVVAISQPHAKDTEHIEIVDNCRYGNNTSSSKTNLNHYDFKAILNELELYYTKNHNQETLLMYACANNYKSVIMILLEKGVDINQQNDLGWTALIYAIYKGHFDIVKLLIEYGADINIQDKDGWTSLIVASYENNLEVVQILLENSADLYIQSNCGQTAYDVTGSEVIQSMLKEYEHNIVLK